MSNRLLTLVATFAMLSLSASVASAQRLSPAGKCEAAKNQEAGKFAACLHKAEARLIKTKGLCSISSETRCYRDDDCPVAETCVKDTAKVDAAVAKCGTKFGDKWDKLEAAAVKKGDVCPDGLLASDIHDAVDDHVANIAGALAGAGLTPCTGQPYCGDGGIDAGEDCDLGNLDGGTCAGEGFAGGVLSCGAGCVYDTSECYAARFVDNADGTISDNDTGLTWEKKVKLDFTTDLANLQDADNFYRWSGACSIGGALCQPDAPAETACLAGVEGDPNGCAQCVSGVCNLSSSGVTVWQWLTALNTANYAGHADWRLATKGEYVSIIDDTDVTPPVVNVAFHGASCGAACTDVNDPACSCTRSINYWSASTYAPNSVYAWFVYFSVGTVDATSKPHNFLSVRAVRGGS